MLLHGGDVGSNPSFVWRSLLSARDVITKGSIWSIRDGGTAGITSHKWLPYPPTFHVGVDTSLKVGEFINPHTKQWDKEKVNTWFLPPSRDEVLGTRLGRLDGRDNLMWNENKSQTFSMRSAYQVALQIHRRSSAEHSRAWDDKQIWNRLWKLPIPPKVHNFVWRAYSNILPTRANLCWRKVHLDPKCKVCGEHDEIVIHIL